MLWFSWHSNLWSARGSTWVYQSVDVDMWCRPRWGTLRKRHDAEWNHGIPELQQPSGWHGDQVSQRCWPGAASDTGNLPSYQGLISTKCMCRCHSCFIISCTLPFEIWYFMILRSLICPEFGILGSGFFRSKACILATAPVKASWKYNVCGSRNHLGNLQVCWVCWLNACFWVVHFRDDWRAGETHDVHFSDSAIGSFLDILVHAVCPGFVQGLEVVGI